MKKQLIILIPALLYSFVEFSIFNKEAEQVIYQDEPIIKDFKDSDYSCTAEQLKSASIEFMKCDGTPVFRDCYAKLIKENCSLKTPF